MKNKSEQNALLIASYLLRYPDIEWLETLKDTSDWAEELRAENYSEPVMKFLEYSLQTEGLDMAELYVKTFDFTKKANLYMTYYLFEDQRERGAALLNLKRKYYEAGYAMEANELPDFLPVILEFAAVAKSKDILLDYVPVVYDIYKNLSKDGNPYANVLKAILLVMDAEIKDSGNLDQPDKKVDYVSYGGAGI